MLELKPTTLSIINRTRRPTAPPARRKPPPPPRACTQAAFATEQVIDELAEKLKIDPIEFRLKNAAKEGTRRVDGPVYPRVGLIETLEAAKKSEHWKSKCGPLAPRADIVSRS